MTGFKHADDDLEWESQEHAFRDEQTDEPVGNDVRVAQYRYLARLLRRPKLEPMPDAFATLVLARIERLRREERFETWLQRGLLLLLTLIAAAALAPFFDSIRTSILRPTSEFMSAFRFAQDWSAVATLCLLLTWVVQRWWRWISLLKSETTAVQR